MRNVEKCVTARQTTNENKMRLMYFGCRIVKATHSDCRTFLFHGKYCDVSAAQYYVISLLPVLFKIRK